MRDPRRTLSIAAVLVVTAAAAFGADPNDDDARAVRVRTVASPPTDGRNNFYVGNRAPLEPSPLLKLPIGSIRPDGWLRGQLERMRDGFTGHLPELSPWCRSDGNAWMSPDGVGHSHWEELPYWLKGYGDLGYVLDDPRIRADTLAWIEAAFASQQDDGWFGPRKNREWPDLWPNMIMLNVLQSYHEATGDDRVIDLMRGYFRWQHELPRDKLLPGSWQKVRGGDNLESVYWLYNRTGDEFLLELARAVHEQTIDWAGGIANWHGVNICQGFREPAEFWMQSGDPKHLRAAERNYRTVMGRYGRVPGGMFGADENCRDGFGDPRQAAETCSMVEFMHSFEMLVRMTGNPAWADRCEDVAFNSLPASMPPDLRGLHYLTAPNMILLDAENHAPGVQNGGCMLRFDPRNYRCCQHNVAHGWPYFAEELWLATPDNGLCAALYAPSTVRARVGDVRERGFGGGVEVAIRERTDYPFEETVRFEIDVSRPVEFPLYLRIPGWCDRAAVDVNGDALDADPRPASWLVVERTWADGDEVVLRLPMTPRIRRWEKNHGAVSVDLGPLTFSLRIEEDWQRHGDDPWPAWDVRPASPWNYGLEIDPDAPTTGLEVIRDDGPVADQPFTLDAAPVRIRARARKIPEWQPDRFGLAGLLQDGPARTDEPVETVTLVPMGAARLRISAFPIVGTGDDARRWVAPRHPPYRIEASHCHSADAIDAVSDGIEPASSDDPAIPRMTWWDHRGTAEWIEYEFPRPRAISWTEVYWFDDRGHGGCRAPEAWRALYRDGDRWVAVPGADGFPVERDRYNRVSFDPVTTTGLRIEAQLQPDFSGGILEWKVDGNELEQPVAEE